MGHMCLSLTAILANCVNMLLIGPVKIQQNIKSKSHLKNKEQLNVTRACLLKTPELVIRRFKTRIYSGLCGCVTQNLYRLPNLYRPRLHYVIHSKPAGKQMIASSLPGRFQKTFALMLPKTK